MLKSGARMSGGTRRNSVKRQIKITAQTIRTDSSLAAGILPDCLSRRTPGTPRWTASFTSLVPVVHSVETIAGAITTRLGILVAIGAAANPDPLFEQETSQRRRWTSARLGEPDRLASRPVPGGKFRRRNT